jgi:hypothetical protein
MDRVDIEKLKGKRVYGFAFEDYAHNSLHYNPEMDKHIGEIGEIVSISSVNVHIKFNTTSWEYPVCLIKDYLIEKENLENSYYEIY